jgi:hypothetical protein
MILFRSVYFESAFPRSQLIYIDISDKVMSLVDFKINTLSVSRKQVYPLIWPLISFSLLSFISLKEKGNVLDLLL